MFGLIKDILKNKDFVSIRKAKKISLLSNTVEGYMYKENGRFYVVLAVNRPSPSPTRMAFEFMSEDDAETFLRERLALKG